MNEQNKANAGRYMTAAKVAGFFDSLAAMVRRDASGMTAAMTGDTMTLRHPDGSVLTITFSEEGGRA